MKNEEFFNAYRGGLFFIKVKILVHTLQGM